MAQLIVKQALNAFSYFVCMLQQDSKIIFKQGSFGYLLDRTPSLLSHSTHNHCYRKYYYSRHQWTADNWNMWHQGARNPWWQICRWYFLLSCLYENLRNDLVCIILRKKNNIAWYYSYTYWGLCRMWCYLYKRLIALSVQL